MSNIEPRLPYLAAAVAAYWKAPDPCRCGKGRGECAWVACALEDASEAADSARRIK